MDKTQFNEALISLIEYAAANGNHLIKKDVDLYFKDILTEESMYSAIYTYLAENNISIDDVTISATANDSSENNHSTKSIIESEQELEFLEMYKSEIAELSALSDDEKNHLAEKLSENDPVAMTKLTEHYLGTVQKIAHENRGRGLSLGDLIQEGNVGLMLGLSEYTDTCGSLDNFIKSTIQQYIDNAVNIQINSDRVGTRLAGRMNSLDELSRELTERLGHAPSVKELAEEMNISEDEVDTIIRTSLNVLSVEESKQ